MTIKRSPYALAAEARFDAEQNAMADRGAARKAAALAAERAAEIHAIREAGLAAVTAAREAGLI